METREELEAENNEMLGMLRAVVIVFADLKFNDLAQYIKEYVEKYTKE